MHYRPIDRAAAVGGEPTVSDRAGARPAPLISVIVPVRNEEDAIAPFVARVGAVLRRHRRRRSGKSCSSTTAAATRRCRAIMAAHLQRAARARDLAVAQFRQGSRAVRRPRPCRAAAPWCRWTSTCRTRPKCSPRWSRNGATAMRSSSACGASPGFGRAAQAADRRPLLPRPQLALERQDPGACRRLPPARPQGRRGASARCPSATAS